MVGVLRAITGQQPISAGRLFWSDKDISKMPQHQRARSGIAYVPQGREIFPLLTVKENLETGFAAVGRGQSFAPDLGACYPKQLTTDKDKRRGHQLYLDT